MRFLFAVLLLINIVTITSPLYAANIWEKRKQAIQEITEKNEVPEAGEAEEPLAEEGEEKFVEEATEDATLGSIKPEDIIIPEQYGIVIETHKGTNGKLIVHIQDAHANYEAQMNLAHILESLIEDYNLKLVLLEGKVTDRDFSYVRDRAPLEERIEKADKLLKEAYINGVDYISIATDRDITIQGIEDKNLYDVNGEAMWEIDKFKDLASEYTEKMLVASDKLKPQVYNQALIELDQKKKDYDAETIDLLAYYEYLYRTAESKDIPLYTFPNFQNLIKASDLEKKIDLAKIRDGSASDEETGFYNEYLEATRSLNINELFKEEPLLEDVVQDMLAENSDQKTLMRISKAVAIMKNLLEIKVVPEEYKYFAETEKDFDPKFWADFLNKKSQVLGLSLDIPGDSYAISDNLAKIERFYETAMEREKAFLTKSSERIEKDNLQFAALVAGGFHTPTLTDLLADAGYSYIVISPKVTTETDEELYRWALKRDWLPDVK